MIAVSRKRVDVRRMTVTAMLSAVATVLMFFSFNVPLMPSFIKLDFSELPALIAAFGFGPLSGATVCLVKNLVNLLFTTTGGVGELSNFVLGASFVVPAGLVYKLHRTRIGALIGSVIGALAMAVIGVFSNYYVVYPVYTAFMPMEVILNMYRAINSRHREAAFSSVASLAQGEPSPAVPHNSTLMLLLFVTTP